jgi:PleD family two-component response regulator
MTKLLKRDKRTRDIPIIALGILEEKEMIRDALDAGIEDYYVKAEQRPTEYVQAIDDYLKDPENYKENYIKLIKK